MKQILKEQQDLLQLLKNKSDEKCFEKIKNYLEPLINIEKNYKKKYI